MDKDIDAEALDAGDGAADAGHESASVPTIASSRSDKLAVQAAREQRLIARSEKRGSDVAARTLGKDCHDMLSDAAKDWASYAGPDGKGPSHSSQQTYHTMFKRMVISALGIDQRVSRDDLNTCELIGVMAVERALAFELTTSMARNMNRSVIRKRYAQIVKATAEPHRAMILAEMAGDEK